MSAAAEEAAAGDAGAAPGGWEDTKENFVPLKQGRAAAAVLATPLSSVKKAGSDVEAQKRCAHVCSVQRASPHRTRPPLRFKPPPLLTNAAPASLLLDACAQVLPGGN
jgi:hypothetical protein